MVYGETSLSHKRAKNRNVHFITSNLQDWHVFLFFTVISQLPSNLHWNSLNIDGHEHLRDAARTTDMIGKWQLFSRFTFYPASSVAQRMKSICTSLVSSKRERQSNTLAECCPLNPLPATLKGLALLTPFFFADLPKTLLFHSRIMNMHVFCLKGQPFWEISQKHVRLWAHRSTGVVGIKTKQ